MPRVTTWSQKDPARHPRWDHIVNIVDRNGRLIESWEQHNKLFVRPHRILVNPYDPERHVWLVDDGAHAIFKFTRDGKQLVQTIGTPQGPGQRRDALRAADRHRVAARRHVLRQRRLHQHARRQVRPERQVPHVVGHARQAAQRDAAVLHEHGARDRRSTSRTGCMSATARNHRIQIFDENGKFLEHWPNVPLPYSLMMTDDQFLWSASGQTQKFTKYDLNGKLLAAWGTFGAMPGGFWGVHQFHVDSEGNLYTADVHVGRPQKFRPKPNLSAAERARLISAPFRAVRPVTTSSSN